MVANSAPVVAHTVTKVSAMVQTTTHEAQSTNACRNEDARTRRIRDLNDEFRRGVQQHIQYLGRRLVTAGVWALGPVACFDIMSRVRTFEDFDGGNDPWHEHDFGAFDYEGHKIFWKIDYYDKEERAASPDPADPGATCRLLTVMLASDY
jgi:hypothetical protein